MAAALGNNHDAATASTAPKKQRNQYNLEFKLEVASQYEPNVHGRGFEALARQYGISKSNVMDWVSKKPQMLASLAAKGGHAARQAFRLDGCGRKSAYTALEDKLGKWVLEQNAQGVRVKDKDIKDRAMLIFREMHPEMRADDENAFKASSGWLARFKIRKNLVVRRPNKVGGDDDEEENIPVAGETNAKVRRATSQAAKNSVSTATTVIPPNAVKRALPVASAVDPASQGTVRIVSAEWMEFVDQRFAELSQQIHRLVDGQNLLLGMLQRLGSSIPVAGADSTAAADSVETNSTATAATITDNSQLAEPDAGAEPLEQTSEIEVVLPHKRRKIVLRTALL